MLLTQTFAYTYSSDPKQFITEIVDEAKVVLNSKISKEEKSKLELKSQLSAFGKNISISPLKNNEL